MMLLKPVFILLPISLHGCTVLAVADAVGSVAVGTVGLAADAAIGTVRLGGKAIGAVAGAAMPNSEEKEIKRISAFKNLNAN